MAASSSTSTLRTRVSGCATCRAREQRIARHLATMRERSRVTGFFDPNRVSIGSLSGIPRQTAPRQIRAEVTFRANLPLIVLGDEDACPAPTPIPGEKGMNLRIALLVDGQERDSITQCFSDGTHTVSFNAALTRAGTRSIQIVIEGAVSGEEMARTSRTTTVTREAPPGGAITEPGPAPGPDGAGPLGGLLGPLGGPLGGAFAVLLLIVLAAALS